MFLDTLGISLTPVACFAWPFAEQKDVDCAAVLNTVSMQHENCCHSNLLETDRRMSETADQYGTSVY